MKILLSIFLLLGALAVEARISKKEMIKQQKQKQKEELIKYMSERIKAHETQEFSLQMMQNELLGAIEKNYSVAKEQGKDSAQLQQFSENLKDTIMNFQEKSALLEWEKAELNKIVAAAPRENFLFGLTRANYEENWKKERKAWAPFWYIWTVPVDIVTSPLCAASWALWGRK